MKTYLEWELSSLSCAFYDKAHTSGGVALVCGHKSSFAERAWPGPLQYVHLQCNSGQERKNLPEKRIVQHYLQDHLCDLFSNFL